MSNRAPRCRRVPAAVPHRLMRARASRGGRAAELKGCALVAEDSGTGVAVEGAVLVPIASPGLVGDVLAGVASPAVRCDLDPVNWLRLETVYDSGAAID